MNIPLALKINKLVHEECKGVPHDIGLRIMELIDNEQEDKWTNIADIQERDSSRIHYESKKDAEANKESEWISVNDRMPKEFRREPKYIEFRTLSGMLIDGYSKRNAFYDSKYGSIITSIVTHWRYKNNEPKEEEQETSRTAGETMFIAEVREVNSDIKIYHVVNTRNKDEAVLKVEKYYEIKAELNGRCYVTNIKDYEYIS